MGKDRKTRSNRQGGWRDRSDRSRPGGERGGFRGGPRGRGFGGNRDGNRFNTYKSWQNKPKRDTPGKRLSEEQIGVTKYMSDHEGFNGIIKSRYSDFQVSEINEQGEVAKLTTLDAPVLPAELQVDEDEELLLSKYNVEILPMDTWDQINKVALGTTSEPVQIDVTKIFKAERTKIHEAVKKAFGESIVGSTINIDNKKFIKFEKFQKGVRIDNRVKWMWPAEYVYFIVHKENVDTMEAAVRIADRLRTHIKPSMLGFAGTKDRRARTSQWFSARRMDPRRLAVACRAVRDVHVGDYCFRPVPLKLGMLAGNKFRIALRNVTAADAAVDAACAVFQERGFINYYGLQRFGTRFDVPTFDIGLKLLKGNFQEAIDSILSPREGPLEAALRAYRERGAASARYALPYSRAHAHSETRLILALADSPRDLAGALMKVPRNMRLLYLHSYQSLVWNRCVSERLARAGAAPTVGDLVLAAGGDVTGGDDAEDIEAEESDNEDNQYSTETNENIDKPTDKKTDDTQDKPKIPVKVLTQEDVDSNKYTMFDIVMPLPGYLIDYPPNMKDYYEKLLTADGLTMELRNKNRSYSMCGAYRRVAVRASDVTWQTVRYSDPRADLLLSDLQELQGDTLTGVTPDGEYKALLLTFSLPPSSYATMALRELMKVDTSGDTQAAQNDYHKRKLDPGHDEEHAKRAKGGSEEGSEGVDGREGGEDLGNSGDGNMNDSESCAENDKR